MPKLPALTADDVIRALLDNGFVLDHQRGSHRVYFNAVTGKRAIVPYHRRDFPKGTLLAILKQAGLSRDDL
jgi:predicted RNA binding protein YcfA (HicA-like mRNA interferase family)